MSWTSCLPARRIVRTVLLVLLGPALLGGTVGCLGPATPLPPRAAARPSVVILSLDTLRPDHLSGYGSPRGTSPALDRLAAEGIVFTEARSQSSGTLTSHLSLLTSLYPRHIRITRADLANVDMFRTRLRLPAAARTLAEILKDAGYETAAFTDGGFLSSRYGFGRGFDTYEESDTRFDGLRSTLPRLRTFLARRAALGKREPEADARPLLLFLHSYDVHEPYQVAGPGGRVYSRESFEEMARRTGVRPVPSELNERLATLGPSAATELRDLYDNGLRATDGLVETLVDLLRDYGLYEDSVVIVISDHGEEFLEHGRFNHSPTVYEELVRVPLIVRLPGGSGARRLRGSSVALLDVGPTVLDLVGLPPARQFQGRSLRRSIDGTDDPELRERRLFLDTPDADANVYGVLEGRRKFLRGAGGRTEMYDLESDPRESRNLAAPGDLLSAGLDEELGSLERSLQETGDREGWGAEPMPPDQEEVSAEDQERLRALGYTR